MHPLSRTDRRGEDEVRKRGTVKRDRRNIAQSEGYIKPLNSTLHSRHCAQTATSLLSLHPSISPFYT